MAHTQTIASYFGSILDPANDGYMTAEDCKRLDEFSLDCHCGLVCRRIIDKAKDFQNECDSHSEIRTNIQQAALQACLIICFG